MINASFQFLKELTYKEVMWSKGYVYHFFFCLMFIFLTIIMYTSDLVLNSFSENWLKIVGDWTDFTLLK